MACHVTSAAAWQQPGSNTRPWLPLLRSACHAVQLLGGHSSLTGAQGLVT